MSTKLKPDQPTPPLSLPLVGGGRFDLSQETPENFTMIVVYRGHHCPVCKKYLTQLAGLREQYEAAGFGVVAVSMNGQTLAEQTHGEWELGSLRVAYGLTVDMARDWGLWVSKAFKPGEQDIFAEPGLFWVRPGRPPLPRGHCQYAVVAARSCVPAVAGALRVGEQLPRARHLRGLTARRGGAFPRLPHPQRCPEGGTVALERG